MPEMAFRPSFHFLPESNWINDPNGLIEWAGRYHFFYQANPLAPDGGLMVWGHAASADLVHWERLPVAIRPDTPFDQDGCWTGCAVDHNGVPTLIYTGRVGETEYVCRAISPDGLKTFIKPEINRLEILPPQGVKLEGFRDPSIWREEDGWTMVIGCGFTGKGGAALIYRSPDLLHWEYLGPLLERGSDQFGTMWECPNFFPLGDRYVLIVSAAPLGHAHYFTGRYENHRLIVEQEGVVDQGGFLYAPQVMRDHLGRTILFGWVWEGLTREARLANGWAGLITLPRLLSLGANGGLCNVPVSEVETLRGSETHLVGVLLEDGKDTPLPVEGNAFELQVEFEAGVAIYGVKLACSPDGQEETRVGYDPQARELFIDRSKSSLFPGARGGEAVNIPAGREGFHLDLAEGETLKLRLFFDHSVIEVFANDRLSLTSRVYPTLPDAVGVSLFAYGRPLIVRAIKAWTINSIW